MAHSDPEARRRYHQNYYRERREAMIADQKARDAKRLEEVKTYRRAYYQRNKEALKAAQQARARKALYGLEENDFADLLEHQGMGCAICGASPRVRRMVVDHDHKTGKVRGILCHQCNLGIGLLGDCPLTLVDAAEYLARRSYGATSTKNSELSNELWAMRM